jgi:hypothetical protein
VTEQKLDIILEAIARNTAAITETEGRINSLGGSAQRVSTSTKVADEALGNLTVTTSKHGDALNTTIARTEKVGEAERDLTRDGREAAKAMGALGASGAEVTERFSALAGVMGSGGGMGIALGAVLVGVGALVEGGKKINETYQEQLTAAGELKQATDATGASYEEASRALEDYVKQSEGLVSNVNQAKDVEAGFIRAGFDVKDSMTDVSIAVNLAAIKHEDLATAGHQVLLMLEGNGRVARELGIDMKTLANSSDNVDVAFKSQEAATKAVSAAQSEVATKTRILRDASDQLKMTEDGLAVKHTLTAVEADRLATAHQRVNDASSNLKSAQDKLTGAEKDVTNAQDNLSGAQDRAKLVQAELNKKTADGTAVLTEQQRAQNTLGQEWDKFAGQTGPGVDRAITTMDTSLAQSVVALQDVAGAVQSVIWWVGNLINWIESIPPIPEPQGGGTGGGSGGKFGGPRAGGGPVYPGGIYTVGEAGIETLTMGPSGGGYVTPGTGPGGGGGGGTTNIFNIQATDTLATAAAVLTRLLTST